MPHLALHFNPRDLSDAEIAGMVAELTQVVKRHLGTSEDAVSVALTRVSQDEWKDSVYDPLIVPVMDTLFKKPGYRL